jgi:hypothetical protein
VVAVVAVVAVVVVVAGAVALVEVGVLAVEVPAVVTGEAVVVGADASSSPPQLDARRPRTATKRIVRPNCMSCPLDAGADVTPAASP